MIRGYFLTRGSRRRPFVHATFTFPAFPRTFDTHLLVDTGADRTVIGPPDGSRLARVLGIALTALPMGLPSTGVGGTSSTRTIAAVLALGAFSTPVTLTILEQRSLRTPLPPIPSLLGRDVLAHFALFLEERTQRVLLLDSPEVDALHLP